MSTYADTLFTYDQRARMLRSNEPLTSARREAPAMYLGWNAAGHVVRTRADVPDETAVAISHNARGSTFDDVFGSLSPIAAANGWTASQGGPIYRFPEFVREPEGPILVTGLNASAAASTYPWLVEEADHWSPCLGVVVEGKIVSVCFSARWGAQMAIAGLDTVEHARGRGFAGLVTLAWAAGVRRQGRAPVYSTQWDNLASRAVARKLGLVAIAQDVSWS